MKNFLYILLTCFVIVSSCQSDKNRSDNSLESKSVDVERKEKKIVHKNVSKEIQDKISNETQERDKVVLTLEQQLAKDCIPANVTDSIHVVLIIEPDGSISFSEIYKAPNGEIQKCIKDKIESGKLDFGQITSVGETKNKTGKTLHNLVLVASK